MLLQLEPIVAISTPPGEGGIAVIRLSGKDVISLVQKCFNGKELPKQLSHTAHYGKIIDQNGRVIDEVVATLFISPKSYTGEDTVEISCHGGVLVTQAVLETFLKAGARHAEAGEFTYRAFLNGKLELSQAEAVADLIHAKSKKAVEAANKQLSGDLGRLVKNFRQQIIDATAMIELELDFTEEDVEFANRDQLIRLLSEVLTSIQELLDTYEAGRLIKDGVKTVFVGAPNAGKSTLLNTLLGHERAIVTDIAGTTRDTIDADWTHDGILFKLIDTAGLRDTKDLVEAEGVKRSKKAIETADLVVYLKDLSHPFTSLEKLEFEQLKKLTLSPFIIIGTKSDLSENPGAEVTFDLKISAKNGVHIQTLKALIKEKALENKHYDASSLVITSSRHKDALEKTQSHVQQALNMVRMGESGDFLAIDLRSALHHLGTITGEITNEDILDSIFSRFCIGK
ncbi:tRNA uridine-5-carboxymethylaminomethyl(34) synthesis GTPase MnmE [bacterium]|nr:MAG: tRNA uridine-5-carboxymethylaminomethyl(34) synthesis GTPase MnmE [bacterium]